MPKQFESRRQQWQPKPRPEWVARINDEGKSMDIQSVVPLDENSLLDCARRNTGLCDFGDDNWYKPFQILIKALDDEAELNLMGRLMTRADLLNMLEARLMIEDCYKRHPEIEEQVITQPLIIIGQGRSGTSILQNILDQDPANGSPSTWEAYRPCPPPEQTNYKTDPRIKQYAAHITLINRVIPEIRSMHEFEPELPTESIHLHCLSFISPAWFNPFCGQVPSYTEYTQSINPLVAYEYEKRVLKLLQWRNPRRHWVMKSPYSILHLREILQVYPDAGFIWTHRDPVKALSSVVNLIGTLFWCRSDKPFIGNSLDSYTQADLAAMLVNQPIDWLASGELPKQQLFNIQYTDFVNNPLAEIERLYRHYNIEFSASAREKMQGYIDANPRENRPAHHYNSGPDQLVDSERQAFSRYQAYFNVASEC